MRALSALRKIESITIVQADKGNATVVLDTEDYEKKAAAILDQPPFKKIKYNPTSRIEKRINDTLKKMIKENHINDEASRQLLVSTNGTCTPLFYCTVKIHKPDLPCAR